MERLDWNVVNFVKYEPFWDYFGLASTALLVKVTSKEVDCTGDILDLNYTIHIKQAVKVKPL